ncbi:hypothetical protein [Aliivibrio fischeri]|uniref:Uncharacterized protein n=1 Tax=Aliivibrio fischeri SR5 TaxID=1088719 RepID=A0AAV3EVC0_ALIFS|nr:hypothetical protein [Aliivibrio fischeri]EHN70918.1 hypothetical protein VFSR5_0698 [Aliivibrio fischeri SR5]
MLIKATSRSDYIFEITPSEWAQIKNTNYLGMISMCDAGFTFKSYSRVPERMIKGELFNKIESPKTRAIKSKTDFLTELGLCIHVGSSEIIEINTIFENPFFYIIPDHYRFVCNHIPQIFYPYNGKIITGINGEFDFNSGLFKGSLVFE